MQTVVKDKITVDSLVTKVIEVASEKKGVAVLTNQLTVTSLRDILIEQGAEVHDVTLLVLDSLDPEYIMAFEKQVPQNYSTLIVDQRNYMNFDVRLLTACKKISNRVEIIKVTGKL